jgi:hypothetical protein
MAGEAELASGSVEIRESVGHQRAAARPTKPSSMTIHQAPMAAFEAAIGAFTEVVHP